MNKVQQQIVINLQEALAACNMADVEQTDPNANDLPAYVSRQHSAYGFISQAIAEIAGQGVVEFWIENGYFEEYTV